MIRLFTLVLLILLLGLVNYSFEKNKKYNESLLELEKAKQTTLEFQERNKMMEVNIEDLKNNTSNSSAEDIARNSLGMIKEDEKFYRIVVKNNDE